MKLILGAASIYYAVKQFEHLRERKLEEQKKRTLTALAGAGLVAAGVIYVILAVKNGEIEFSIGPDDGTDGEFDD